MWCRLAGFIVMLSVTGPVRADSINDVGGNPSPPFNNYSAVFPNWTMLPTSSFTIWECADIDCAWCLDSSIVGITMMNYGTASGGPGKDITGMYFKILCGSTNTAIYTMNYAGDWTIGADTWPAWTWAGAIPWNVDPNDTKNGCAGGPSLFVYTDVGPCPYLDPATLRGNSIELGPGYNDIDFGGITDDCWSTAPWAQVTDGNPKEIAYIGKECDLETAAPGDTINYTLYIGKPGTSYTNLVVMDSQPPFTHLVAGSDVPPADPGYNPDPGPPARLRWTLPGATSAGGATQEIHFQLTVDWGNGEMFEPGSGDVGAPENAWLSNYAQAFWVGMAGCGNGTAVSPAASTVVNRFLFWKIGSNDILFAPRIGMPNDEMVYEIFLKNVSARKTWWDVKVWDTVPALIDVWSDGYGLEDPCTGWTMTPSGCAAASAGKIVTSAKTTVMTWKLDMPPGMTLTLRFKAQLRPTSPSTTTIINIMALREDGRAGIVDGTGSSQNVACFTHLANVILRTTYFSYCSYAGSIDTTNCNYYFMVPFFPLNQQTNFEFRKLEYEATTGMALAGGKSDTINVLVGSCVAGFMDQGWSMPGCKIERAPAIYYPGITPLGRFDFLYKVTSNSPVLWQMMAQARCSCDDSNTWAPSTSLTYCGFMHYMLLRPDTAALAALGHGDRLAIVNTSLNSGGIPDPFLATTVHLFKWDPLTVAWAYAKSGNIAPESIWMPFEGTYVANMMEVQYCRVISSVAQNLVYEGFHSFGAPGIGGAYDNYHCMNPNRETGNLTNAGTPANYYVITRHDGTPNLYVGNVGAVNATWKIYKYMPASNKVPSVNWPTTLAGNLGSWSLKGTDWASPGLANVTNGHIYGGGYDRTTLAATYATGWKIEVQVGSIQVGSGANLWNPCAGGINLHDALGNQAGRSFWMHKAAMNGGCGNTAKGFPGTMCINVFCPKTGMVVGIESTSGASAVYTTDGPDQAIVFMGLSNAPGGGRENYHFGARPTSVNGDMIAQFHQSSPSEKAFTAPFVRTGTHYELVLPSTVYSGQNFWFTVIVVEAGGDTNMAYNGITSFTSSDPKAQLGGTGMDLYNYTWIPATDKGVHVFINVIFNQLGLMTIVAADIADGSIVGLGTIMVVGVDVKLTKEQRLTIAASGDTIRFKICWSNYSSASAFTFVVTDAVPLGTTYVPEVPSAMNCGSTDGVAMTVAYSLDTTTPPVTWTTAAGMLPAGTPRWLRWTVPVSGVQTTGCACFRVSVN
jgi:uncharacterized repeat protein (TIGR01451 family)